MFLLRKKLSLINKIKIKAKVLQKSFLKNIRERRYKQKKAKIKGKERKSCRILKLIKNYFCSENDNYNKSLQKK